MDNDWLLINLKISPAKVKIYLYLESAAWHSKDSLLSYIPLLLALSLLTEIHWIKTVLVIFLTFLLFIVTSMVTSILHNHYMTLQKHKHNFLFRIIIACTLRIIVVRFAFWCGKVLSPWMSDFPITSNELDVKIYQGWINEGSDVLLNLLSPVGIFLENPFLPHNILVMLLFGNVNHLVFFSTFCSFIIFLLSAFFLAKYQSRSNESKYYPFRLVEKGLTVLLKLLGRKHYTDVLFHHQVRTDYFFQRFPILLGSLPFWLQLGLLTGLISSISSDETIFYLIISFYLLFFVFFYVDSVYTNLQGIFSLDSEGKKVVIHFMAKKNLWDVFIYKLRFFIVLTFPLFLLCDIVFTGLNLDIRIGILTIFMHTLAYLLFTILAFLPSVVSPHFNFINVEQLDDYPEKKTLQDILKFVILGIFIPCSMLPAALLVTDLISFTPFILFQWIGVSLILLLAAFIIILLIRKKLKSISGIDKLLL
ncbi:hypothetical protein WKH31_11985 [Metabacillus indicus]|uniref:hypothetical protein n=1 Tax=Metabacillus indicus TaxID=246786 RepID=UPI00316BE3ED